MSNHSNAEEVPREVRAAALKAGWRIKPTAQGHEQWFAPDGKTIVVLFATGARHEQKRNLRKLERAGLVL